MLDQIAIFTPQGQLLFAHNLSGKRFSEKQVNNFIVELLTRAVREKESVYSVLSTETYTYVFQELRNPALIVLASYSAISSLELNKEAEEAIALAVKLWKSLRLNEVIIRNTNEGLGMKNHPCWVLDGAEEELATFKKYFIAKCEATRDGSVTPPAKGEGPTSNNGQKKKTAAKRLQKQAIGKSRKWINGMLVDDDSSTDSAALDFSMDTAAAIVEEDRAHLIDVQKSSFGTVEENGDFLIKEIDDLLNDNEKNAEHNAGNTSMNPFSFLQKHFLGNKVITTADLKDVLSKLKKQLITKNVAPSVADYLVSQVSADILGTKTENWTSVQNTARGSLEKVLTDLLTPGVSVDLLHEIQKKTARKSPNEKKAPYVFSVVGVNGVGKSTNLSKLAFWLLQNRFRVLIVACDTFRSGAVEQLKTHVENLAQLTDEKHLRGSKNTRNKTGNEFIELFEGGYGGTDLVTKIAKQAINYAHDNYFDVVLMDTAGRRHNDATLMSPLKSFAEKAKPDKIIMVGEALVGTDSVQQARNFNQAFGKERNLDFYIISKCDTVGDMLGTMVNMVYATGIPILFIGVGQTYTDLRTLSVKWAVRTLLS